MNGYRYSIIVPHKNIPDLLQRCLDSIPEREDIQVIVVDDNSDPLKVDFDHFPGKERRNVEVYFDKSRKGAGRARNIGLSRALGEWVIFSDADDCFEPRFNEILEYLNNEDSADIVYYDVISKDSDTLDQTDESNVFSQILHCNDEFCLRYQLLTPWMKAIRRSFIIGHGIKFEEVPCSNDTRFSALCGFYAKKINVLDIVGYCWMRRNNSLWRSIDINWCITRYKVSMSLSRFMRHHKEERAQKYFESSVWGFLSRMEAFSKYKYVWYLLQYGIETRNRVIVFRQVPRYCLYHLKLKCGINISTKEVIRSIFG